MKWWPWLRARVCANFGPVVPNEIYRSGQGLPVYFLWPILSLKTVINVAHRPKVDLRDRFEKWYAGELGIEYIERPTLEPEEFNQILDLISVKPSPLLIHCDAGKDRTGALIAAFEHEVEGKPYSYVCSSWEIHGIPNPEWLTFLFERWGK